MTCATDECRTSRSLKSSASRGASQRSQEQISEVTVTLPLFWPFPAARCHTPWALLPLLKTLVPATPSCCLHVLLLLLVGTTLPPWAPPWPPVTHGTYGCQQHKFSCGRGGGNASPIHQRAAFPQESANAGWLLSRSLSGGTNSPNPHGTQTGALGVWKAKAFGGIPTLPH